MSPHLLIIPVMPLKKKLYILIFKCPQRNRLAKAINRTLVFRKFHRTDNVNGPWPTLRFGSPFVDFWNEQYIIIYYIREYLY